MELIKLSDNKWQIPQDKSIGMRVPGIIFASEKILNDIKKEEALKQVINVAQLPGIVKASMAMPDIHWGYGFPIGGVAATDIDNGGVISPGGVGFDINCGVRCVKTKLEYEEIKDHIPKLMDILFAQVPCGVGSESNLKVIGKEQIDVLEKGVNWAVSKGFATDSDRESTEDKGCMPGADASCLSDRAKERGRFQLGTLGAGNHFLEIQKVDKIYDDVKANKLGLFEGQITIMLHSGSRGLGYQVCEDYIKVMRKAVQKYGYKLPDSQLCCASVNSPEGKRYYSAMACAANYAWVNRQLMMERVRAVFEQFFGKSRVELGISLIYDVCHNVAKIEKHIVDGREMNLCVHRKGATRAFPGIPVLIPGSMGTSSFLLEGTEKAMQETFGSACHGAGRVLGRRQAIRQLKGRRIDQELKQKGVSLRYKGKNTLYEEAPSAYKDVSEVVASVKEAGLVNVIARMKPLGCMKG